MNSAYIIDTKTHKRHIYIEDVDVVVRECFEVYGYIETETSRRSVVFKSDEVAMQIVSNGRIIFDNTRGGKDELYR
jgi:hypothetical protein